MADLADFSKGGVLASDLPDFSEGGKLASDVQRPSISSFFDRPFAAEGESEAELTEAGKGLAEGVAEIAKSIIKPKNIAATAGLVALTAAVPPLGVATISVLGAKQLGQAAGRASVAAQQGDVRSLARELPGLALTAPMVASPALIHSIRPAIRTMDNQVIVGKKGQVHDDIIKEHELPAENIDRRVFVDAQGNQLSREQTQSLTGVGPGDQPVPGAHASELAKSQSDTQLTPIEVKSAQGTPVESIESATKNDILAKKPTSEQLLEESKTSSNPVSSITGVESVEDIIGNEGLRHLRYEGEKVEGLVSVGEQVEAAINKANAPGDWGVRGPSKPPEEPITVKPSIALKTVLKAAEKSGEAGYTRGRKEALEQSGIEIRDLNERLQNSVTKARALSMYFAGQEKGAQSGATAMETKLEIANRWWQAQKRQIADSLIGLVRSELPLAERSKFTKRIADIVTDPGKLTTGDPDALYEKASMLSAEIINQGQNIQHVALIDEIKDIINSSVDSPSIDAFYRERIKSAVKNIALSKMSESARQSLNESVKYAKTLEGGGSAIPVELQELVEQSSMVPISELSMKDLSAMRDSLESLVKIGRLKLKTRRSVEKAKVGAILEDMSKSSGEALPLEKVPEFHEPMTVDNLAVRFGNWWIRTRNQIRVTGNAILPIDALMDMMDGAKANFVGFLHRNFRGPVDLNEQAKLRMKAELLDDFYGKSGKSGLSNAQWEKIGIYAYAQQPEAKAHLIESGVSAEKIAGVKLDAAEQSVYDSMRKVLDTLGPEIQRTKYLMDNEFFTEIENYFPIQRDARRYSAVPSPEEILQTGKLDPFDPDLIERNLASDLRSRPSASVEKGFTKERVGGRIPIRINARDVFLDHVDDALHYIHQQPTLKRMANVVSSPEFRETYGDIGQKFIADWVNVIARNGNFDRKLTDVMLDWLRRNSNVGIIGFRLGSQLKHLSNWPFAIAHVGPGWFYKGMQASFTKEGRDFLDKYFPETQIRSGGEPAIAETEIGPLRKSAFFVVRQLDRKSAESTALGAYMRLRSQSGIEDADLLAQPVNMEFIRLGLVKARRAIASPLSKDIPLALSKGAGLGGNVSVARTLLQFNNVFLDRWSNLRLELINKGYADLANNMDPRQAATFVAAFTSSIAIAAGVSYGWRELKHVVTGHHPKKERTFDDDMIEDTIKQVPFMGQLMGAAIYGNLVPALGLPVEAIQLSFRAIKGENEFRQPMSESQRQAAAIRAGGRIAAMFGLPLSEVSDVIAKELQTKE